MLKGELVPQFQPERDEDHSHRQLLRDNLVKLTDRLDVGEA
jgi:hypothetical protein